VESVITAQDRLTYIDSQTLKVRAVFGTAATEWEVQVINPDSVLSNTYTFHTEAPPPRIDALRPLRRAQSGEAFMVTVQGATFTPYSTVRWNGEDLSTTPIKSSPKSNAITIGLEATVPASSVEGPGRNAITVHTPSPGGGTSPPKFLTVTPQPFYRTTWFYLGIVGVIVLIGIGLHRLRLKHVRERELERKVEQRTQALREEKEKTEAQAERLEALDEARRRLFEDLSHELRTPLTMISTPLHTVLEDADGALPDDARELLEAARRNAKQLENLVDQVTALSRLEAGRLSLEPQPGDLVAFAHETTRSFEPMAEQNDLQLRLQADPDQLPTVFDSEKLRSVLGNLIENALHYTPDGGKVLVRVERPDAETAALRVSDTGPGIPEDEMSDLFDRFHRGESSRRTRSDGSGLGLALAQELTELHDGTIEVESEVGLGSTFTVHLPLREPEDEQAGSRDEQPGEDRAEAAAQSPSQNGEPDQTEHRTENEVSVDEEAAASPADDRPTILVVEDNADVRAYLRNQLTEGYCIQEAEDGKTALYRAREEPPALILSDVMMPEMDGVGLCRRVKSDDTLRDVPVLLLTAKTGDGAEVEGLDAGADAYVEKPFSMETLRARIQNLIESRAALREKYRDEITIAPSGVSVTPEAEKFYEEARAVVEAHIDASGFTVEQFAGAMSVSRSTLRRRLKDATGQTPGEFVRHLRLERAAQLLREDADLRVYEVADAVGYESPDHFGRLFREHFGISPSEYPSEE
jgi:signal transduction histidine kinase/DNA-binding response OmpR family regulator